MAEGAIPASGTIETLHSPSDAQKLDFTATRILNPGATEGGSIFYDRKRISATWGKNREILLTFDDGPHPNTTPLVLDILKKWNLKGIFFLVGMNVRKYPELVKRIHREGHTLGNHTWSHIFLPRFAKERILQEIRATNGLIKKITGVTPTLFRPPYGALNRSVVETLKQERMDIMLWSVDPGDWRNRNIYRTVQNLSRQLHLSQGGRGGIVLLHDTLPSTAHALDPFLTALSQQGLIPGTFGGGNRKREKDRGFWVGLPPRMTPKYIESPVFKIETLQRPILTALLQVKEKKEFSPLKILRAKKAGKLVRYLLTKN